jgi:hypothetical protein
MEIDKTDQEIAGYTYGHPSVPPSPVSWQDFVLLKQAAAWTDEDAKYISLAGEILADQTDAIVGSWREVIAAVPHLAAFYCSTDGVSDLGYKAKVGERFKQWILDVCQRPYDQTWLDYQHEIGLRHTHLGKNRTDGAQAVAHIPMRYMIVFTAVINERLKPFLAASGRGFEEIEAMHRSWCKAVLLHLALWCRPYVSEANW